MQRMFKILTRNQVKDRTINFLVIIFVLIIAFVTIGCLVIIGLETIKNETVNPAVIAILSILAAAVTGLITISHTTSQINGTAAQAAQEAANTNANVAAIQKEAVAATIEAMLSAQKQADMHSTQMETLAKIGPPPSESPPLPPSVGA